MSVNSSLEQGDVAQYFESLDAAEPCPISTAAAWVEDSKALAKDALPASAGWAVDLYGEIMTKFMACHTDDIDERREAVKDLLNRKQQGQRTKEWYEEAATMLTASEFDDIFGSPLGRGRLVMKKAHPAPIGPRRVACKTSAMTALDWGMRFEPVAKQVLEREWGAVIGECGRLYHPTMARLAASPDGFIIDADDKTHVGRLLEIKCPISRKIGGDIPHKYWVQMQIQMEVTGIAECDYVEMTIASEGTGVVDFTPEGYLWVLSRPFAAAADGAGPVEELIYAYTEDESASLQTAGWTVIEKVGWAKKEICHRVVKIDNAWFKSTLPVQKLFWEDVSAAQRGDFVLPESTRAKKCLIED
jgi:hypothetical protein